MPGWKSAGVLALLCSTVAWASFPRATYAPADEQMQWRALGVGSLSKGGVTGMPMAPTGAVEPLAFVPKRTVATQPVPVPAAPAPAALEPLRIRGKVGDGLYWSLRAAGVSPQAAAQY